MANLIFTMGPRLFNKKSTVFTKSSAVKIGYPIPRISLVAYITLPITINIDQELKELNL